MTLIDKDNILIDRNELPETYRIITDGGLYIDDLVKAVFISGSREPAGGHHSDSDIDISLIIDISILSNPFENELLLKSILTRTLNKWKSDIELDTAILFDINNCNFKCFLNYQY